MFNAENEHEVLVEAEEEESKFVVKQDLLRMFGMFSYYGNAFKEVKCTEENHTKMKELYNRMIELLPLIDPIIPLTLKSRKSGSTD